MLEILIFVIAPKSVRVFLQVRLSDPASDVISVVVHANDVILDVVPLVKLSALVLQTRASRDLLDGSASPPPHTNLGAVALLLLGEGAQRIERRGAVNSDRLAARRTAASTASVSALLKY